MAGNKHYMEALQQLMREKRASQLTGDDLSESDANLLEDAISQDEMDEDYQKKSLLPSAGPVRFKFTGEKRHVEEPESPYTIKKK